jgi:hypothetical protein
MLVSGDEFWVRLTDLTPLVSGVIEKSKPAINRWGKTARIPLRTVTTA